MTFRYAYGIGVARNEYSALLSGMLAAERGSIPAKSIAKMLHDAYMKTIRIDSSRQRERLKEMGDLADRYLFEALTALQDASVVSCKLDEEMTRICLYLWRCFRLSMQRYTPS